MTLLKLYDYKKLIMNFSYFNAKRFANVCEYAKKMNYIENF